MSAFAAIASSKWSEVNDDILAATAGPTRQLALRLV
jgi:hypothetical protein